ncbi:hypothetical protein OKA05_24340 [Luteolibacter arcticus]|uniref:F5/8 type C domain-containing protein n=1 Tax=Luteolibacter arcticus TaxID=1581411 RepID=A0ABT3GQC3_9BACT|nr:ATP-binding protein [Luteolibacter arcticus]MCW1925710.1 hypothetical protein [Luteolibacter arcticus]
MIVHSTVASANDSWYPLSRMLRNLRHAPLLALFMAGPISHAEEAPPQYQFPEQFSERLRQINSRLRQINTEIQSLPVMSDIDARGSHGFHSNFTFGSEDNWFEVSWESPQTLDGIAMVPTRITTQSGIRSNYGFPGSLRIEATRHGESERFILAEIRETRLDLRRGEPLFLDVQAAGITALRFIPESLLTLPGKDVRFFSLAELMVYQGQRNIARGANLRANFSIDTEVGWNIHYLTDEQSSLGPPELPLPGKSLGWHGDVSRGATTPTWAIIDLGTPCEFESVRLVAARGDAPIKGPGFGFPARFHVEVADEPADGAWKLVWSSGDSDVTNPGYNPMTIHFPSARGRYVRVSIDKIHTTDAFATPRILLSEVEVLHGFENIALSRPVSTPDSFASVAHDATRVWSRAGLTDGHSSTGRLIHERDWVRSLSRRFDLICERSLLASEQARLHEYWDNLRVATIFGVLATTIIGLLIWQVRQRLHARATMITLRNRISSDLHDEVGSNLATISLLSEFGPTPGNLDDINRLSRETSLALREIVEINLASKRARKPLPERLRDIASLMLREQKWSFEISAFPVFDLEQRKHLVFFFKEALHNIIRHSKARNVRITFETTPPNFRLLIEDDGLGIQNTSSDAVAKLYTLRQRASSLAGTFTVESKPGEGTRITLLFPNQSCQ